MNKNNSLKAATLAAAKVNAMLYAKGKLKLPDAQKTHTGHSGSDRSLDSLITREYEINDVPAPARNLLTRGFVQDEICKYSGASISTRGRYLSFEEKLKATSKDRPLYLHIQGSSKEAVNLAMARIQEMIGQFDKSIKPSSDFSDSSFPTSRMSTFNGSSSAPTSSGGHYVQDKVFVGLESSSSSFSVRERILGPGSSFLQHIKIESGATVTLRGRGSGYIEPTSGQEAFEPMYIHLTHPKPEGLQAAKILAMNLIDTVHAEYSVFQQQSEQALMPVGMGGPPHLPFQGHVAVVSSVPTILTPTLISSVAQGLAAGVVPAVSSVQTVLTQPLTSQGVYTSNQGFQMRYVNALADGCVQSLQTLNTVPMPSITPVSITTGPTIALGSVPLDPAAAAPNGSVPLSAVSSGLVAANQVQSLPINPVTSMALSTMAASLPLTTMAPIHVNSMTSMPLNTMSALPVNPITSIALSTMGRISVNPVTSMPLSTVTQVHMATSLPSGPVPSVPVNLLPPGTEATVTMVPPQPMPMNPSMVAMGPPPLPQPGTGYRELVSQQTVGMLSQALPPTTYTHLYLKHKQQQQISLMGGHPSPVQQGQKRKFREEVPDIMPPPPPMASMTHPPPYRLGRCWPERASRGPSLDHLTDHRPPGPEWHPPPPSTAWGLGEMWTGT